MDGTSVAEAPVRGIVITGLLAALYAVLTIVIAPLSYGPLQFRVSTLLVPVVLLDKRYGMGIAIGVMLGNIISPFGFWDWMVMPLLCAVIYRIAYEWRSVPLLSIGWIAIATSVAVAVFPLGMGLGLSWWTTAPMVFLSIAPLLYAGWFIIWRRNRWTP